MRERARVLAARCASTAAALSAAVLLALPVPAPAQLERDWAFAGTVEIDATQIAFLASGNLGSGVLEYEGGEYAFRVGGLGIGGFGIQRVNALGAVYNLPDLARFSGTYVQARIGATLGSGRGAMRLSNEHGVILDLRMSTTGVALSIGADGMVVTLDSPR